MTLLSKHEKRDSRRLPNAANLSKSLILSLFLYFIPCFVTEELPSPHGTRQWLECPQYTGTNHMPVYEGTNQVYAVTAGATVPAAFAGVHRNHHFDTMKRLHPLLHPPKYRRCSPPSGYWIRLLFILWRVLE